MGTPGPYNYIILGTRPYIYMILGIPHPHINGAPTVNMGTPWDPHIYGDPIVFGLTELELARYFSVTPSPRCKNFSISILLLAHAYC